MRNLKKILAMALTVLMVVGSFAMTATAAFDDVTDYQEAIEVMAALGIAAGKSETEFAPDDDVTREEMALWIAKIMTGKVAADYVTNNFLGAVENLTAFADLDEDNYVGAINYATNNGIIVGTSATTFEPAEAIKIQDVFAMVVRMLGYGSTAMNNNYPWSFIDKAISLGLDADLPADYSNEAVASRGETMQILYNALTALKSDGSTLGYDFFGLEKATVVITGTADGNMYNGATVVTKTVDGEEFVSFSLLNANGTVAANDTTYYALKSEFGIEGDAQFAVGASYVVRTVDGFASFLTCEACDSVVLNQDAITGDMTAKAPANTYVNVDGTSFKLVKSFSDFIANNDTEIIFTKAGAREESYDLGSYVMDADLNILAADGVKVNNDQGILLYWKSTNGSGNTYANLNGMYLYQLSDGTFIQPTEYIWSLAKKATITTADALGFEAILNSNTGIEKYDAYSDTVLYDDDADGNYDRAIYVQYKFGRLTDDGSKTVNGVKYPFIRYQTTKTQSADGGAQVFANLDDRATSDDINVLAEIAPANTKVYLDGEQISFADIDGKFVLYNYIPLYETILVKEIFEENTGLVTGIDLVNKKITLNAFGANIITGVVAGETYNLGNAKLSGATFDEIKAFGGEVLANIIGKNIKFVEKDGNVLAIYNAIDDAKYMVYVNAAPGFTTMGYNNILAYYDPAANKPAATQAVVTVNAVNNYWYSAYVNGNVANTTSAFALGDVLKATKDSLGNYDVAKPTAYTSAQYDAAVSMIAVNNGIVSFTDGTIAPFAATANTVWIIWDESKGINGFKTFQGIPTSGAEILPLNGENMEVYKLGDLVYVVNGEANGEATTTPWGDFAQNSTIIYVDNNTVATMQATNAYKYGMGINVGMTYSYSKAFDMINGGYAANVMTDYNFNAQLIAGNFYKVVNGYVVDMLDATELAAEGIKTGLLLNADSKAKYTPKYAYTIVKDYTDKDTTTAIIDYDADEDNLIVGSSVLPKLYFLNGLNVSTYEVLTTAAAASGVAMTSTQIAAKAYADGLNLANANGENTAVEVYYFEGTADRASLLNSAPVFVAKATSANKTAQAYVAPVVVAPVEYTVGIWGYDAQDGALVGTAFSDVVSKIKIYEGIKAGEKYNVKKANGVAIEYALAYTSDNTNWYYYADKKYEGALPEALLIAMDPATAEKVTISYVAQDVNGAPVRKQITGISTVDGVDLATGMVYYAVPVSAGMVYYDNANVATNNVYINLTVAPAAADTVA